MNSTVSFYTGLGICSFAHLSFAQNHFNERLCSDHSGQMSDCEQIAKVTHDKRVTVSDLLRLLMIKEQITCFFLVNCSFALSLTFYKSFL